MIKAGLANHLSPQRPRLRVYEDGTCRYEFTIEGWIIFEDIAKAYAFLKEQINPLRRSPAFNRHW